MPLLNVDTEILSKAISNKLKGFLVTMDIEKAFDSLDHDFLSSVLRKFGFGKNSIT